MYDAIHGWMTGRMDGKLHFDLMSFTIQDSEKIIEHVDGVFVYCPSQFHNY
jgi:hypothetical protein